MNKTTIIILVVAVLLIILVVVIMSRRAAAQRAQLEQQMISMQPQPGGRPAGGGRFIDFLGQVLPVVLANTNKSKPQSETNE